MELIEKYLDRAKKMKGLYVIYAPEDTSLDFIEGVKKEWERTMGDENLIILPDSMKIEYIGEEELEEMGIFENGTGS